MAKGNGPCVKCYVLFTATLLAVLAVTGVWNPFPGIWEFVNRSGELSTPDPRWQQRLGGTPKTVTVTDDALVVEHRTKVEGRGILTGNRLWERDADWSAVAGDGEESVVVTGELLVKGFTVVSPATGAQLWADPDAVAVWTYLDAVLEVSCYAARDCELTGRRPLDGEPMWTVGMPGVGFILFADNPALLGTRLMTVSRVADQAGGPEAMPQLLGFPVDGRVYVVNTAEGQAMPEIEPAADERVVAVGGRVLRIRAVARDGTCYFSVEGRDWIAGRQVWRLDGANLRTGSGGNCEQREDPFGAGNVVAAVAPDMTEVLIDAYDGRVLWSGEPEQRVASLDNLHTLVRSPDGKTVSCLRLGTGELLWSRKVDEEAQTVLTRHAAVIVDQRPDRITAVDPETGAELVNVRSTARVLATGPAGLVIGDTREIAYLPYGTTADIPRVGGDPAPDDAPVDRPIGK